VITYVPERTPGRGAKRSLVVAMSVVLGAATLLATGSPALAVDKFKVQKTADNASITAGEAARFTIVATAINTVPGDNIVENFTLTDNLPPGDWSFGDALGDAAPCAIVASVLTCNFGDVPEGQTRTVHLARITTSADCNTTITNTASVNSLDDIRFESGTDLDDNTSTASMTVTCAPPQGKTFTIGPSSMEGHILITPGDFVSGGYSFKFKINTHVATTFTVTASVAIPVTCPLGGGAGGTITVDLGTRSYSVPAGNTNWLPTGDQNSILSWMGSTAAPDLCGGQDMDNKPGATFTATVSQNPVTGSLVDFRFKYRDPASKGKPNTDCTVPGANRDKADVCGASWSQTVTDP
jgi:hypothetical protein